MSLSALSCTKAREQMCSHVQEHRSAYTCVWIKDLSLSSEQPYSPGICQGRSHKPPAAQSVSGSPKPSPGLNGRRHAMSPAGGTALPSARRSPAFPRKDKGLLFRPLLTADQIFAMP